MSVFSVGGGTGRVPGTGILPALVPHTAKYSRNRHELAKKEKPFSACGRRAHETREHIQKFAGKHAPHLFLCVVMTLFDKKEGIFIRQRQFFYVLHKRQHL